SDGIQDETRQQQDFGPKANETRSAAEADPSLNSSSRRRRRSSVRLKTIESAEQSLSTQLCL
ncbi:unnamed protein product, partial [Heterosigma akashiwo]